jgi:GAF domain-containing protein
MLAVEKVHTLHIARPQADQFRLAALHRYHILDTPACEDFSFLTELAAQVCEVPYAFISLVDADRVWIKSCTGMQLGELPRGEATARWPCWATPSRKFPTSLQTRAPRTWR